MTPFRVGTDCSGIDSPVQALKQLEVPFEHVFACDIDSYCRQQIMANHPPQVMYGDLLGRTNTPYVDLYVCGFPCQSFSNAGNRKGFDDPNPRNKVFDECVKYISEKKPKVFILENVNTLVTHDQGRSMAKIMNSLEAIPDYQITWKILNTLDYGIPQNRKRVYFVGIWRAKTPFEFPEPVTTMANLNTFVDHSDTVSDPWNRKDSLLGLPENSKFVNLNYLRSSNFPNSHKWSPTLLTQNTLWCVPYHRRANCKEHLKLQGFPTNYKQVVSKSQFKKQIGNSMSVNVMKAILSKLMIYLY
jgi:DNA (cytosine-5)-methyltransferase 1